jgi:predicted AlkP superfamily phosphohydrolase/phosphomutase
VIGCRPFAVLALLLAVLAGAAEAAETTTGRTIVIGFDGMDPKLAEQWMADGTMPNFAKLRERGYYQVLPTTNPAQSPVAWASFATGLNPGGTGQFDFLSRDPTTYGPDYGLASVTPPQHVLKAFGFQLPLDSGTITNKRVGTPFWVSAEQSGQAASVLRVPGTFPPDPITRMLSGMGVPDLLGTQGTFTYYTTEKVDPDVTGGRLIHVDPVNGRVEVGFEGPSDPFRTEPTPLSVPVVIEQRDGGVVHVGFDGRELDLKPQQWSDWVDVKFTFGAFMNVRGLVRLYLLESFPNLKLYVSPIQIDPRAPAVPISSPAGYAADLASRIGLYHTIGMPEETWALNDGQMTDDGWLDMEATILKEREAMFFDTLARKDTGLVVMVFVQTDRVSHMFWRGLDEKHPLYAETSERGKGAIKWIYGEADRILGRTVEAMSPNDRLIVLSDHGFTSWRHAVHLNRWLVDNGFMATKPGQPASEKLFTNVNWPRTQAYAIGLNDIYLNRKGREALGIVRDDQVAEIKRAIIDKLTGALDPETGEPMVLKVYDAAEIYAGQKMADAPDLVIGYAPGYRASWQTALGGVPAKLVEPNNKKWSGDHLVEPSTVPGVLFASDPKTPHVDSITDMKTLIRAAYATAAGGTAVSTQLPGTTGWFDIASPALSWIDGTVLGWLPVALRVAVWAAVASLVSMVIYRLISGQDRLTEIKAQVVETRTKLQGFEGEFAELWPILRHNLALAGRQLWHTFVPAVVAGFPVIFILVWMSNAFDARPPEAGAKVAVTLSAVEGRTLPPLKWSGDGTAAETAPEAWDVSWPAAGGRLALENADGASLLTLPTVAPVRTVAQWAWWNRLIGNPGGYLATPGEIAAAHIDLPEPTVLPFGPAWLRGWLPLTLLVLVVLSLFLKSYWRLH